MKAARKNMVDCQIHTYGVVSEAILKAYETVPRELFAPDALKSVAYGDEDLNLGQGRCMLAPPVHAKMMQAANPQPKDKVLDVGGGPGYSAAILSSLSGFIVALEDRPDFLEKAAPLWAKLGMRNVEPSLGPMPQGAANDAPFDLIFVNGAVSEVPHILASQLSPEGRMIAIIKDAGKNMGQASIIRRAGDGFAARPLFEAAAPYLPGFEPKAVFKF